MTTSGGNDGLVVTTNGIASINNKNDNLKAYDNEVEAATGIAQTDDRKVYIDEAAPTISVAPFGQKYPVQDTDYGDAGASTLKTLVDVADYTENVPYTGSDATKRDNWLGHVEYASDSIYSDSHANLSGQVTFKGKAADNQAIYKITAKIQYFDPDGTGSVYLEGQEFPIYTLSGGALNGTGWYAAIDGGSAKDYKLGDSTRVTKGHVLGWNFTFDTSLITSAAQTNVAVVFKAYDNTYSPLPSADAKITVDIVPYVTKVDTALSGAYSSNPSVVNRSALGVYPVRENETITLRGFNFGGAATAVTLKDSLTPSAPTVTVGGISGSTITASAAHGYSAGQTVYFGGTTLPSTSSGRVLTTTPYYVSSSNLTTTKFEVSAALGGASVVFTSAGGGVTVQSPASVLSLPIGTAVASGDLSVVVNSVKAVNNNHAPRIRPGIKRPTGSTTTI